jgi:colicin import membrane protein
MKQSIEARMAAFEIKLKNEIDAAAQGNRLKREALEAKAAAEQARQEAEQERVEFQRCATAQAQTKARQAKLRAAEALARRQAAEEAVKAEMEQGRRDAHQWRAAAAVAVEAAAVEEMEHQQLCFEVAENTKKKQAAVHRETLRAAARAEQEADAEEVAKVEGARAKVLRDHELARVHEVRT